MKSEIPSSFWLFRRAFREAKRKRKKNAKVVSLRGKYRDFERLKSPDALNLFDNVTRVSILNFISDIHGLVRAGRRKILLDFTCTTKFSSGGTILLLAEMTRLCHLYPELVLKGLCPRNGKAAQVMKQTGLAKILRMSVGAVVRDHDVVNWKCASGQGALGERCDEILGPYDGVIAEALSDHLYRGLTEAMTNVHHHAYIQSRGDGFDYDPAYRPWWMFSQEKDGCLNVVFCDLGCGIPATLPIRQAKWWKYARRFGIDTQGEGKLIQGAVRNSQSRTRKLHRGKGLRQIAETISLEPQGRVHIYSNRGLYTIRDKVERTFDYRGSIMGTVIQWRMPLPASVSK